MAEGTSSKWSWIWAVIALLAIAAAVYLFLHPRTVTVTHTEFQKVPEIQRVVDVQKVYVPVKQVRVLEKHQAAEKLDMPWLEGSGKTTPSTTSTMSTPSTPAAAVQPPGNLPPGDPQDLQVTTTADLEESENGYEAASVLNTATGESTIVVKEKVSPWFQFENGLVAGLRYGVNTSGGQSLTPYAGYEFLRVKDLHFIGYTELNTNLDGRMVRDIDGKIQLDIQYRRK